MMFTADMGEANGGQSCRSITEQQNPAAGQGEVGRIGCASLHSLTSIKQYSIKLEEQNTINKIYCSVKIQRVNSLLELSIKLPPPPPN